MTKLVSVLAGATLGLLLFAVAVAITTTFGSTMGVAFVFATMALMLAAA